MKASEIALRCPYGPLASFLVHESIYSLKTGMQNFLMHFSPSTGTFFVQKWPNTSGPWLGPPSVFVQAGAFLLVVNRTVRALASCLLQAELHRPNPGLCPGTQSLGSVCARDWAISIWPPEEKLRQVFNSCSWLGTISQSLRFPSDSIHSSQAVSDQR